MEIAERNPPFTKGDEELKNHFRYLANRRIKIFSVDLSNNYQK